MAISDNLRGSALMMAAMVAFTINDSCMKAVTADLPIFQATAMRGALTVAALIVIGRMSGALRWPQRRADLCWMVARMFGEVTATLTFLIALKHMPLANLSAVMQFLPLAVTLTAAAILRERVGWRRMSAIAVGFLGVMLIVRPGTDGFDHWSVLGLLSVACVVIRDLSTRRISAAVTSVTVAVSAALSVAVSAAAMLPFTELVMPTARHSLLIAGAAIFLVGGYLTVVMSMRVGDIAVVAPFRYTSLVAAILLGWAVFGQFPDQLTLVGSAIVVATGIYTFYRERRLALAVVRPVVPLASD